MGESGLFSLKVNANNWEKLETKEYEESYHMWAKVIQINENDVYFISGFKQSYPDNYVLSKACFRYSVKNKTFERIADIKTARSTFGITSVNEYIYAFGGNIGTIQSFGDPVEIKAI